MALPREPRASMGEGCWCSRHGHSGDCCSQLSSEDGCPCHWKRVMLIKSLKIARSFRRQKCHTSYILAAKEVLREGIKATRIDGPCHGVQATLGLVATRVQTCRPSDHLKHRWVPQLEGALQKDQPQGVSPHPPKSQAQKPVAF